VPPVAALPPVEARPPVLATPPETCAPPVAADDPPVVAVEEPPLLTEESPANELEPPPGGNVAGLLLLHPNIAAEIDHVAQVNRLILRMNSSQHLLGPNAKIGLLEPNSVKIPGPQIMDQQAALEVEKPPNRTGLLTSFCLQ